MANHKFIGLQTAPCINWSSKKFFIKSSHVRESEIIFFTHSTRVWLVSCQLYRTEIYLAAKRIPPSLCCIWKFSRDETKVKGKNKRKRRRNGGGEPWQEVNHHSILQDHQMLRKWPRRLWKWCTLILFHVVPRTLGHNSCPKSWWGGRRWRYFFLVPEKACWRLVLVVCSLLPGKPRAPAQNSGMRLLPHHHQNKCSHMACTVAVDATPIIMKLFSRQHHCSGRSPPPFVIFYLYYYSTPFNDDDNYFLLIFGSSYATTSWC